MPSLGGGSVTLCWAGLGERKNNLQPPLEILYLMHLVCLHLKGNVRRAAHRHENLSLRSRRGLTCLQANCRSAFVSYSLQMNSRNACLSVVERLTHIRQVPAAILAPPLCSMDLHCSTQLREVHISGDLNFDLLFSPSDNRGGL